MSIELGGDYTITIPQGGAYREVFQQTEDDEVTPIPFPLGTTARSQMRASGVLLLEFMVEVVHDLGQIIHSATPTQTNALLSGGRYDIFVDYPGAEDEEMWLRGRVNLKTRSTV